MLLKQAAATAAAQLKLVLEINKGKVKIVQHTVCLCASLCSEYGQQSMREDQLTSSQPPNYLLAHQPSLLLPLSKQESD